MNTRAVTIRADHRVELDGDPSPSPAWRDDGAIRWLIVEGAIRDELQQLFDQLGVDGGLIAVHICGEHWMRTLDREAFAVVTLPEPTAWREGQSWFQLALLPQAVVSVHRAGIPDADAFVRERWLERPGPPPMTEAVLQHLLHCYVEEEEDEYDRVSFQVEQHAEGLRRGDETLQVERVEELMTRSHHLAATFLEQERFCEGLCFLKTSALSIGDRAEQFRDGARYLSRMRLGADQVLRRLEGLHQQHRMDQQQSTEARLRVLTVLSAIFLPLTLIAGVYGMNFDNMPELHDRNAYFLVLGAMAMLSISMLLFFVRRGWFR